MDTNTLTVSQRQIRRNIRNFLLGVPMHLLQVELRSRQQSADPFAADCVQEIIAEREAESALVAAR